MVLYCVASPSSSALGMPRLSLESQSTKGNIMQVECQARDMKIIHKGMVLGSFAEEVLSPGISKACDIKILDEHHQRNEEWGPESLNAQILGQLGPQTDHATYALLLRRCTNAKALSEGKCVHEHMSRRGYARDTFLSNLLIQMYSKCGSLEHARAVFDKILNRNLYSWNNMITASAQNGSLNDARAVFGEMPHRDVISWNAMIAACAQNGHYKDALQLFCQMEAEGFEPNKVTFICVVDACATAADLEEGRWIHATLAGNGWVSNNVVGNALVNMYGKCRRLDDAWVVFAEMPHRNIISWSGMITACGQNGHGKEALQLFGQMQMEGFEPNNVTFICIVDACARVAALEEGQMIHASAAGNGWESDVILGNALIGMYGKCGSPDDAWAVFADMPQRNAVSWRTTMATCAQNGHGSDALQLFHQMQAEYFEPDKVTFICGVDACSNVAALEEGQVIHATVVGNGWESDVVVGTALVNMYGKSGSLADATAVFVEMLQPNLVSWSAMITVCVQNGRGKEALQLFGEMKAKGLEPNKITFLSVVDACASLAALVEGQVIHAAVSGNGWESEVIVGTAIVTMYGKCGGIDDAVAVFAAMPQRTVVSWNSMITAYAQNGHGKEALHLLGQMQAEGFEPNTVTFVCILTACSHTGLVVDGRQYFDSMIRDHGITPSVEHYWCMIDLLGRRGLLEEAEGLIISMPHEHVLSAWSSLLSSCRIHNDVERAVHAAYCVVELDPKNASQYVLLPGIHANAHKCCEGEQCTIDIEIKNVCSHLY